MRNLSQEQKDLISENTICDTYVNGVFEEYHSKTGGLVVRQNETKDKQTLTKDGEVLFESNSRSDILDKYVDSIMRLSIFSLEN